MGTYIEEIKKAMSLLAKNKKVIFIGQSVRFPGTGLFNTIEHLPENIRWEIPVFEDIQMGMSIGLSLEGYIPISIYPRMDFLILAYNQLFNHLDLIEEMSEGQFKPKIIIRTSIGSIKPLFPSVQHNKDHYELLKQNLRNVNVVKLTSKEMIELEYKRALESEKSTILIEIPDLYET